MAGVVDQGEILLYGNRYRVVGPIQRELLDPLPQKIVDGDYTRDDTVQTSSWLLSDLSGGLGVEVRRPGQTDTRYYYGTIDTRFPDQTCLPPLVTNRGNLGNNVDVFFELDSTLYACVGTDVYRWSEGGNTWGASIHTLPAAATDSTLFGGKVYLAIQGANNIVTFDGASWGSTAQPATHLCNWNNQLWAVMDSNQLMYSSDGTAWSSGPTIDRPVSWVTQLLMFWDFQGDSSLYAVTKDGLWAYNTANGTMVQTAFTYPPHPNLGQAAVWQGGLYLPVGAAIYAFDSQVVNPVGPDKDAGLPGDYAGALSRVIASHGYLFTLVDGAAPNGAALSLIRTSTYSNDAFFSTSATRGALLASNGKGWHLLFALPTNGTSVGAAIVTTADAKYRLWFSSTTGTWSMDLPTGLYNPIKNTTQDYALTGSYVSSWYDGRMVEMPKTAVYVKVIAKNASATETISIYSQVDEDDAWTYLGQVTATGRATIPVLTDSGGQVFRRIRFRVDLARGSDSTKTPILDTLALEFIRRPVPVWGYQLAVDLSQEYKGRTPGQMREELDTVVAAQTTGEFTYRPEGDTSVYTKLVVSGRAASQDLTGNDRRGRYPLSLLDLSQT